MAAETQREIGPGAGIRSSVRRGYSGVWKLIYWNILAFAARLVLGAWVFVALFGGLAASSGTGSSAVGWVVGATLFFGIPVAYGYFQQVREVGRVASANE